MDDNEKKVFFFLVKLLIIVIATNLFFHGWKRFSVYIFHFIEMSLEPASACYAPHEITINHWN